MWYRFLARATKRLLGKPSWTPTPVTLQVNNEMEYLDVIELVLIGFCLVHTSRGMGITIVNHRAETEHPARGTYGKLNGGHAQSLIHSVLC